MLHKIVKIISLWIVLGMSLSLHATEIKGKVIEAVKGEKVNYPISVADANQLGGLGFTLMYDTTVLEFIEVQNVELSNNAMIVFNEAERGQILISMIDANGMNGNGLLMEIKFTAIGEIGTGSEMVFSEFRSYDTNLLDVPIILVNGAINIK